MSGYLEFTDLLIVEDNPHDVELMLRAWRRRGIKVSYHVVEDGVLALDYLYGRGAYEGRDTGRQPKAVLLDLKLPRLNGLEVLGIVKKDDRLRRIPVVVLTSSREERDLREAYRLGANSYVVKPVDFDAFMAAVVDVAHYWVHTNEVWGL
ncbi:MAG TPA: response regulator [Syntrophales bacterium]|nr:response regulator [Syntrophales bacterium]HOM08370.1 response regulator [Syntrophales bacterium]